MRRRSGRLAKSRHHDGGPADVMSLRKQRHKRQKTGKTGYRGRKEKIERLRDGLAAVLAEHSTDGRSKTAPVGKAGKSGPCDPLKER